LGASAAGIAGLPLRLRQLADVLSSPTFSSLENAQAQLRDQYREESRVSRYLEDWKRGLIEPERSLIESAAQTLASGRLDGRAPHALVIGCGTGREVFALEEMGMTVLGADTSPEMIRAARSAAESIGSKARFVTGSFPDGPAEPPHLIHLTVHLANQILGRASRVSFFRELRRLASAQTLLTGHVAIQDAASARRSRWSSRVLRLRAWVSGWTWEPGDLATAGLGRPARMEMFHHYPDRDAFAAELLDGGWQLDFFSAGFFRARALG
jgi:SAM-dependent methyltransferase